MTARSTPAPRGSALEAGQTRRAGDAGNDAIPEYTTSALPETACPRCGVIDTPVIGPGSGPHHASARCPQCGAWLRWLSGYTPQEQAARREQARQGALASRPPSVRQLDCLSALGCSAPMSSMLSASITISAILQARRGGER